MKTATQSRRKSRVRSQSDVIRQVRRTARKSPQQKVELRPVYMVYPGLYPMMMMNFWMRNTKTPIVGILISDYDIKHQGKYLNLFELILALIDQAGWRYMLNILFFAKFAVPMVNTVNFIRRILGKEIKIKTFEDIAREKGIPIYRSKNFNGEQAHQFIRNVKGNIIVSAFNNQILRQPTFELPEYKAVNIHPALLPNFRGLDGPFEAMYHDVPYAGVTIHYVDKDIDTGRVILQQKVKIRSTDSLFSLSMRCWVGGAMQLEKVFEQVKSGRVKAREQNPDDLKYPYQSFPQKQKVREFLDRGKKIFTWHDLKNTFKD